MNNNMDHELDGNEFIKIFLIGDCMNQEHKCPIYCLACIQIFLEYFDILSIVFNVLKLIDDETNEDNRKQLMNGLLLIMVPTNNKIKGWIKENLTC